MAHTREVPDMPKNVGLPYFSWQFLMFATTSLMASSQLMRSHSGFCPFGVVRRIG